MAETTGGSLCRANKRILGSQSSGEGASVFTLHNWSPKSAPEDGLGVQHGGSGSKRDRYKFQSSAPQRARLLLFKAQESALNFLFRWLVLDELDERQRPPNTKKRPSRKSRSRPTGSAAKARKVNRAGLLLKDVARLPDRRLTTVAQHVFWRWLTWTNVIELVLIAFLVCCCALQCYLLLEEYFSYPTHVIMTKSMNENFRKDLPAITLCSKNLISKSSLKKNYPNLNYSHYLAISYGTFYSVDNFTLDFGNQSALVQDPFDNDDEIQNNEYHHHHNGGASSQLTGSSSAPIVPKINWAAVFLFLTNRCIEKVYRLRPDYDLVDTLTCANIWGVQMPCENFKRIKSLQYGRQCSTLFHDSVFWNPEDPGVHELEVALRENPSKLEWGTQQRNRGQLISLLDLQAKIATGVVPGDNGTASGAQKKPRATMGNMEMIRIRIDFRSDDYAHNRTVVGGILAIHSNSVVGHSLKYYIEPGHWYNYYVERFDYKRLPPPYDTNCYDYQRNRYARNDAIKWNHEHRAYITSIIRKQAAQPDEPLEDYVNYLRRRSMSGRECINICTSELPASKCNCWPRAIPYMRYNNLDIDGNMHYCDTNYLMKLPNASRVYGDDLYYQLCAKEFTLTCVAACPDECNFSSFDVTEQARYYPSHESRRYITDQALLARLKQEAECCATVSVIYAGPTSSYHVTEPKYTRQDIVTIVSGNIEAWVGLSAVHAYLFLEQFYDALVEAQLISPTSVGNTVIGRLLGPLISILTKLKVEICQLFAYLFRRPRRQLARLFLASKTNNRQLSGGEARQTVDTISASIKAQ